MRSFIALILAFSASALAYQVTSPNQSQGWTNSGAQTLTWQRVNTDALNFTAVLTNEDRNVMPNNNQVLAALIDGTKGTTTVNPPSAGWPTGDGFRVNFVQDASNLNTILAQSSQFSIKAANGSSTTVSGSATTVAASAIPSSTDSSAATPTDATPKANNNAALSGFNPHIGLMAALALFGGLLA
jgi:hypothetical protein